MPPGQVGTIVFDGDDTLWETERLYDDARTAAQDLIEAAGLDGTRWDLAERKIDQDNVALMGLSAIRFPTSCREAYERVCLELHIESDPVLATAVYEAASGVFRQEAPVTDGAYQILESLKSDWQLILLTRGDLKVQKHRVEQSGLEPLFDHVRVIEDKSVREWVRLIEDRNVDASHSWSVGNSLKSDIMPAIECGLWAVWIETHVWEYERHDGRSIPVERVIKLDSLAQLPSSLVEDR
jgi:putative hydrolase of the HAD superfamily